MTTAARLDAKDNQIACVMGSGHQEATAWREATERHVRHPRDVGKRIAWYNSSVDRAMVSSITDEPLLPRKQGARQ